MAAMRQHLSKMGSNNRKDRKKVHEECSLGIEVMSYHLVGLSIFLISVKIFF